MRISSNQKIAGHPAIRVRELMRRAAGGPIRFWDVCQILQCSDTAAARVIKYLEKDGLIVSVEGSMEPSTKGNTSNGNRGATSATRNSIAVGR
jgi:hypothetical protein